MTEELDEVFHDANDFFPAESILAATPTGPRQTYRQTYRQTVQMGDIEEIKEYEVEDPSERDVLPYFKDPKVKISIWTILKDSIGKDISKLSVPVYFNDPLNILQKCCNSMEYNDLLDLAIADPDPFRRLALVAIYSITMLSTVERSSTKPFNPLLGETFEYVCPKFRFIAEQVSHHPPITAFHCEGASGYRTWSNNRAKSKFTGKSLNFVQMYKVYVELGPLNERYEI